MQPILTFGQSRNYTDASGYKQGVHDGYSGSLLFERTYVNDTLNGFFRKYLDGGTTLTTGYFKAGLKDSLWIDLYFDGSVEKKECYKLGQKHGEFIHYHKNGKVSYQAIFRNDSLVGEAINYYESGTIKSKGDKKNGLWQEFYENGNLQSKQEYHNGKLYGARFYFSPEGDTLLPRRIKPQLVLNDTSIINHTDLQVYLIFKSKEHLDRSLPLFLMDGIKLCNNNGIIIHVGENTNIAMKDNEVRVYEESGFDCGKEIKTEHFRTHLIVEELKNGDYKETYDTGTEYFKSQLGEIAVEKTEEGCIDTGVNPVSITHNGQTLYFSDIGNLIFFEFDINNDGKNEIYLLNYFTCMGRLEIYRVAER